MKNKQKGQNKLFDTKKILSGLNFFLKPKLKYFHCNLIEQNLSAIKGQKSVKVKYIDMVSVFILYKRGFGIFSISVDMMILVRILFLKRIKIIILVQTMKRVM